MNRKRLPVFIVLIGLALLAGSIVTAASPVDTDSNPVGTSELVHSSYSTVITVTSGEDVDTGGGGLVDGQPQTLRRAINTARNSAKPVLIQFNIPTSCPSYNAALNLWKIELLGIGTGAPANTTFRQLNGDITIDGTTQSGRSSGPTIILYGEGSTGARNCMVLGENATQGDNTIKGLGFQNFRDSITVSSVNNTIEGCWFGLNDAGTEPQLRGNNPASGSGGNGVVLASLSTDNNNNMIQNNKFLGLNGTAATIRGRDNTFRNNQVGMAADGTVTNAGCSPDSWLGGGGLVVQGRSHLIEGNRFAGLRFDQFDLSQPPDAMRVTADDWANAGHTISGNYIGWDMSDNAVGTCGRGIYLSNHMRGTVIKNNVIENTAQPAISMNGLLYNQCELSSNVIKGTTIEYGPAIPDAFKEFNPPKVTSIAGKTVTGTSGDGSPCPNGWVELFLDETETPEEARQWLGRVQADADSNWTATIPFELTGSQGIRTTLTTTQADTIPGTLAGTSTGLSELYLPSGAEPDPDPDSDAGVTLSITPSGESDAGETVTFEATPVGIGNPEYSFGWRFVGGSWASTPAQTSNIYAPTVPANFSGGNMELRVRVREAGTTAWLATDTKLHTINAVSPAVELIVTPAGESVPGGNIVLSASTAGVANPVFRFGYRSATGRWQFIGRPTATATITLPVPGSAPPGQYQLGVQVREAGKSKWLATDIKDHLLAE